MFMIFKQRISISSEESCCLVQVHHWLASTVDMDSCKNSIQDLDLMTRIYLRGTDSVGLSHYEERMD